MVILTSAYLAPIHYYCYLYHADALVEERCEHYVKQTYRNRCLIAGGDGVMALTIPVEGKPKSEGGASKTPTRDIRISEHGRWRAHHWNALVTAYESTPYFDFYAPEFEALYSAPYQRLVDFNSALQHLVLDCLQLKPALRVNENRYLELPTSTSIATLANGDVQNAATDAATRRLQAPMAANDREILDLREKIRPKLATDWDSAFLPRAYYQVFSARHGFLPNLSIVDLLFNMGPESRLVLRDSLRLSLR